MWFDILKNTKTVSQTSGSFDFEEEEIPEATDDDCLDWLRGLVKLTDEFASFGSALDNGYFNISEENVDNIHEKNKRVICDIIDDIKRKGMKKGITDREFSVGYDGKKFDMAYDFGEDWPMDLEGAEEKYGYPVRYRFAYYAGDGFYAVFGIESDNKHRNDFGIRSDSSEPFDDFFRTTLRSDDGKSGKRNPDYLGDGMAKKMNAFLKKINLHFQKLAPTVKQYDYDWLK